MSGFVSGTGFVSGFVSGTGTKGKERKGSSTCRVRYGSGRVDSTFVFTGTMWSQLADAYNGDEDSESDDDTCYDAWKLYTGGTDDAREGPEGRRRYQRHKFDFSKKPKSNVGAQYAETDADVCRWVEFCDSRGRCMEESDGKPKPRIADLSEFMDYYIDERVPGIKTVLSKVHGYAAGKGCFEGQEKHYKTLFSRVKKKFESWVDICATKAIPWTKSEIDGINNEQDRIAVESLCRSGHRSDAYADENKPATITTRGKNCEIIFRKDKKSRMHGQTLQLSSAAAAKKFAAEFPFSWGRIKQLVDLKPGAGFHSFRRTCALAIRIQYGDEWCKSHIDDINRHCGWKVGAKQSEFWSYTEDFESWRNVSLPTAAVVCTAN